MLTHACTNISYRMSTKMLESPQRVQRVFAETGGPRQMQGGSLSGMHVEGFWSPGAPGARACAEANTEVDTTHVRYRARSG